jgi:hypothetical protein
MKRLNVVALLLAGILMLCNNCASRAGNAGDASPDIAAADSTLTISTNPNANAGLQEIDEGLVETDPAEAEDSGDEGYREAEKFWAKYAPTCGGVTYMKTSKRGFVELNGFRITMEYAPITQADQLNGIEAQGISRIQADTRRAFYDSKWHEWEDGSPSIGTVAHFKRSKGQWKFVGGAYFNDFAHTMDCSEIPSSTSAENQLLRFDGLYRAYGEDTNPKDDTTYWLKFYQDGTLSALAHQNTGYKNSGPYWTVRKVWDCLASRNQGEPCNPQVEQVTYSISGSTVEYEMIRRIGIVRNSAIIKENALDVQLKNKSAKNWLAGRMSLWSEIPTNTSL